MIIVTGGAGFIGSNIVKGLNVLGHKNIVVVDDLTDGPKFRHLVDCEIADYLDRYDFLARISDENNVFPYVEAVFHLGACSDTTEMNGVYMMQNNYEYSKKLFHFCEGRKIPFIYASSAATYGAGQVFKESREFETPLNVYGYSKFLFDQYVRARLPKLQNQVVGMRYFNVYGPREDHKGTMSSVAFHHNTQMKTQGFVKLFGDYDGHKGGEQRRDFIYVDDVVKVNLWFWLNKGKSGIYNVGTGRSQSFNEVANAVIAWHGHGKIEYIPFPDHLKGKYQSFTEADMTALRAVGYDQPFKTVEEGVKDYLDLINKK